MTYQAVVCPISLRPHPNADKLLIGSAFGYTVVVGKDTQEGEVGILFPAGGCLSPEMCLANRLYRKHPETGAVMGGFFEENGRVKAIKLRGVCSDAFFTSLKSLEWTGIDTTSLKVGDLIDTVNGKLVCEKYVTPQQKRMQRIEHKGKMRARFTRDWSMFPEIGDMSQLRFNAHIIPSGSILHFSCKCHGCVSEEAIVETLELGPISIGKVVKGKLQVHIKALDTKTNKIVYVPVDDWFYKENDGEWYELELEDGTKLTITANNPIWLPLLKTYRRVDKLQVGDLLLLDK